MKNQIEVLAGSVIVSYNISKNKGRLSIKDETVDVLLKIPGAIGYNEYYEGFLDIEYDNLEEAMRENLDKINQIKEVMKTAKYWKE